MTGFGEELRSERERRGLSLETLCAETKVNRRLFEALEQEDYTALPGGVFRRGIVRAYLASTGLDEQSWMVRFQQSLAEHASLSGGDLEPGEEAWAAFAANVKKNRVNAGQRNDVRWLGVLGMLLVLAGVAWAVWHYVLRTRLLR